MNSKSLTPQEQQETFFVTLGRLNIAIQQANYSSEHKQRALLLFEKLERDIKDIASKSEDIFNTLAGNEFEEEEETLEDHDCGIPLGDGCDVCARHYAVGRDDLPDYGRGDHE